MVYLTLSRQRKRDALCWPCEAYMAGWLVSLILHRYSVAFRGRCETGFVRPFLPRCTGYSVCCCSTGVRSICSLRLLVTAGLVSRRPFSMP